MSFPSNVDWCFCGRVAKTSGRCDRHIGKEPKPKIERIKKFRGDSAWQKENGFFAQK